MERLAFKMQLKKGLKDEYKRRHDQIWPELSTLLKEAGISEYSIFFDEQTHSLFAFQKLIGKDGSQDLGKTEIMKKWWDFMADIMEVHFDHSPVSTKLEEVFYLE